VALSCKRADRRAQGQSMKSYYKSLVYNKGL
jgi:hypothetical protein